MRGRNISMTNKFGELHSELTWEVNTHAVSSNGAVLEKYKALHRNDDGKLLNVVKNKYNVLSNASLKRIIGQMQEFTGYTLEGYVEWDNGGKIFGFLRNNEKTKIADWEVKNYMIVGNSHDSSLSFFMGTSNQVVRCKNAFSTISAQHRIRHDAGLEVEIEKLIYFYEQYLVEERRQKEKFETWHGILIPNELKERLVEEIIPVGPTQVEISTKKQNQRRDLLASVITECNQMGDSLYGLFNGITHYTTHVIPSRQKSFGNVFGHAATLNKRGYEVIKQFETELGG